MKRIKLSGREAAVLRGIGLATGATGEEIIGRTSIDPEDLVDILNGLMDAGYVECLPPAEHVTPGSMSATKFDVNPSYALDLRETLRRT